MKRRRVVLLSLAAVVVLVAAAVFLLFLRSLHGVETAQAQCYARYQSMLSNLADSQVELTEGGSLVGVYSLETLGLYEQAAESVERQFTELEKMPPEEFAALDTKARMAWKDETHATPQPVVLDTQGLTMDAVEQDLAKIERHPSEDAYAYLENGAFHIQPEVQGNVLKDRLAVTVFTGLLSGAQVPVDSPLRLSVELTDYDCYIPPVVTASDGSFDYAALLQEATQDMTIPVNLPGQTLSLQVAPLVSTDGTGKITLDEEGLKAQIAQFAASFDKDETPYLLTTYEGTIKPLTFLPCSYRLDQAGLLTLLEDSLTRLSADAVEAPYTCTRKGEPFSISGTYVEVDIQQQQMTYYKDGEVLVHTDVVTGRKGGYDTPTGYYQVQTHSPNAWLTGPDYRVFVKYWVGFYLAYGIHDASWRTEFGGEKYIYDGSHGCVNTPEAAMKIIYDDITIGTPVVLY